MNNTSKLFENLMLMHESDKEFGYKKPIRKLKKDETQMKKINENDTTLLNLTVELPTDTEDLEPQDVKVDVGVMSLANEEETENEENKDEENKDEESEEDNVEVSSKDEEDNKEEPEKEESLKLEGKDCECTGKDDCECESCKSKKEDLLVRDKDGKLTTNNDSNRWGNSKEWNYNNDGKKEATDVDSAKKRIIARAKGEDEGIIDGISNAIGDGISGVANAVFGSKNESLMHLDTTSLNKLITNFVRDNYKNIDKVVINKAILENHKLTLKGFIKNTNGLKESITLVNRGFDGKKLENKRFLIDFADAGNMFKVIKESVKKPFIFTASLVNGNLKFENLKYNFKTRIDENKIARVYGKCVLNEDLKNK